MSMIQVENLTFSYPSSCDPVFENVRFQIDTDWKLGFVGRNGKGKTTFLKLLMGELEYSGKICASVEFDYFPYPVEEKSKVTIEILTKICPFAEEWEFVKELSCLDVNMDVLWRPFQTLSNGEQTKVLLAALFLKEGNFLLIDEPTNHLDAGARDMVSAYLRKKKGFILVSHDRHFLDGCVDHILSLNRATIEVQSGNFSSWMENFSRQQAFEQGQKERLQKEIRHLKQSARRSASWSDQVEASKIGAADKGYVGHKAAKMMKRAKAIEARQQKAIEQKSELLKDEETTERLKLSPLLYHGDLLVSYSQVAICYDARPVCGPLSFSVEKGERVVLEGKNGSGKSSLLKLLLDQPIPYTGTVRKGAGLVISYVPQDASGLQGSLKKYARVCHLDESLFLAILRKLDFKRIQFEKDMRDFSAGQKKKVLLARSLCEKAHLYVWDEPMNYIDIASRIQIEQLIKEFSPAMILVEHDRAFQENIATKIIRL